MTGRRLCLGSYQPLDAGRRGARRSRGRRSTTRRIVRVFAVLLVATACGGVIFNADDDRHAKGVRASAYRPWRSRRPASARCVCAVYVLAAFAAATAWAELIDQVSGCGAVFVPVGGAAGAASAAGGVSLENWAMLGGRRSAMMFFVFGQIPINDAMVARYTDEHSARPRNLCGALCGVDLAAAAFPCR